MVDEINKAKAEDAGCWIAGWWGQYAVARMVVLAGELGWVEDVISKTGDLNDQQVLSAQNLVWLAEGHLDKQELSDDQWETLHDSAYLVEAWLNAEVAPAGFAFHWTDGEFYLSSIEDLED